MKRWLPLILAFALPAVAQNNIRWDMPGGTLTTQAQGGNLLPVFAIPGSAISFLNLPALSVATTYISQSSGTTCPGGSQVTLNGSNACVATADPQGNFGAWFQPGYYRAVITKNGVSYNYDFTISSGGGGGSGTVTSVSVATANGFQGTVANPGTTPAISVSVDSTHVLPVNTGASTNFLNQAGTYSVPVGSNVVTTKGDLFGYSTVPARIPVGANQDCLVADSTQTLGLKWDVCPNFAVGNQAAGVIPLATGATTIGAQSHMDDGVSSAGVITSTEPVAAPSLISGTPTPAAKAALPTGAHGLAGDESSTAGVPAAGVDYLRWDSVSHCAKASFNGSSEACLGSGSSGFPFTLGSTSVAASSTNAAVTGLSLVVNTGASVSATGTGTIQATNRNPVSCDKSSGTDICITDSTYNASPNGGTTTTATATFGVGTSGTIGSCATFNANNGVLITGAGAAGANYIGTVVSCSGTTLTVTPATSTSVASGTVIQHDETAAFQSAITALASTGGTIYVPDGIYLVNGPLQDTSGANSILKLPNAVYPGVSLIPITITGTRVPEGRSQSATIIKTSATAGNLFGGYDSASTFVGPFTNYLLDLENLTLRSYADPQVTMVNTKFVAGAYTNNVWFDTGSPDPNVTPTHSNGVSQVFPSNGNSALVAGDNITTAGYYTGLVIGEHATMGDLLAANEVNCFVVDSGGVGTLNNGVTIAHPWAQQCSTELLFTGSTPIGINVGLIDLEDPLIHGISDPGNVGYGNINCYVGVPGGGASLTSCGISGGSHLNITNMNTRVQTLASVAPGFSTITNPVWPIENFQTSGPANIGVQSGAGTWAFMSASSAGSPGFIWDSSHDMTFATSTSNTGTGFTPRFTVTAAGVVTPSSAYGVAPLTNGVTATTQTVGDNTTKVATDAFVLANGGLTCGGTPGISVGAGGGTGGTASISGLDCSHLITVNVGTSPTGAATVATITLSATRGHTAYCTFSPVGEPAAIADGTYIQNTGTSTYIIQAPVAGLSASTTYTWQATCP